MPPVPPSTRGGLVPRPGAKDDSRDARVLADALWTDLHCFRRIDPVDPAVVKLWEWSRIAEELTRDRTRLASRVREQLWRYYPQILEAADRRRAGPWFLELWERVPTPAKATARPPQSQYRAF